MMEKGGAGVAVAELSVGGKIYRLPCAAEQEPHLQQLCRVFEARAAEIGGALGDIGADVLFLAAGLSFIEEMSALADASGETESLRQIAALETQVAGLIEKAAARIEAITSEIDAST
ncbi:cell division protein ZapA [bacterium]|nr:cell division protein ZapA [bacterium]